MIKKILIFSVILLSSTAILSCSQIPKTGAAQDWKDYAAIVKDWDDPAPEAVKKGSPKPAVSVADATWQDKARSRNLPVRIYAPDPSKKGPFPAIVISHNLGGSRKLYAYLARALAGKGYVVVVPTHVGTDSGVLLHDGAKGLLSAAVESKSWGERAGDVSFVIDRLTAADQDHALIKGRVDKDAIGVAGHEFGAFTALAVAGQTSDMPDKKDHSFRDERVKAALAMSPQTVETFGLSQDSWKAIKIPTMTMGGTKDAGYGLIDPKERRIPFQQMARPDKWHVTIEDADHAAFADYRLFPLHPQQKIKRAPEHHEWITLIAENFFDAYLKELKSAKDWLQSAKITKMSDDDVKIERK